MKGKLILCEIKFCKVLRSKPGWAIIWVRGPCSCPAWAEGSCVGETCEGTQGEGLQVAREVGPRGAQGSASLDGVYVNHAWLSAQDKLELQVSGLIHSFLSPQRDPLYSSRGLTPASP